MWTLTSSPDSLQEGIGGTGGEVSDFRSVTPLSCRYRVTDFLLMDVNILNERPWTIFSWEIPRSLSTSPPSQRDLREWHFNGLHYPLRWPSSYDDRRRKTPSDYNLFDGIEVLDSRPHRRTGLPRYELFSEHEVIDRRPFRRIWRLLTKTYSTDETSSTHDTFGTHDTLGPRPLGRTRRPRTIRSRSLGLTFEGRMTLQRGHDRCLFWIVTWSTVSFLHMSRV